MNRIQTLLLRGMQMLVVVLSVVVAFLPVHEASALQVDECLEHQFWTYNEVYRVWVQDQSMYRCVEVGGGLKLRTGDESGMSSSVPANDTVQCLGRVKDEIVVQGALQYTDDGREYNGGIWERDCGALGAIVARNTAKDVSAVPGRVIPSLNRSRGTLSFEPETFELGDDGKPIQNRGVGERLGFQLSDRDFAITGISKQRDVKTLLLGFTNFLLPYVSVISVFALVAAGVFYLVSFTNEELNGKAKNILLYVSLGIVVIVVAYALVSTLLGIGK